MLACPTIGLATVEASIERQTETVSRAPMSARYTEMLRLQMLREMRDILEESYRLRMESADLYQAASDRDAERLD